MLHPGGARTALFNHLFARYYGGETVLRIEDTDRMRSERRFKDALLRDLDWLGLTFDGQTTHQSERAGVYEVYLDRLRGVGLTYEAEDEDGRRATYFRPPAREGAFRDELRGDVSFGKIEDFVVRKSDGTPSYNFACVVDDLDLGITHVVRGEEHLSNTARQALLYRAFDEPEPRFAHLGVILAGDGKKLSKRHGAASISGYRERGYMPEAVVNHLALLGWNHPEGREFFATLEDLEREWTPARLGGSPSVFDPERLLSLNAEHIRALSDEEFGWRVSPFMSAPLPAGRGSAAVAVMRQEARTLAEAPEILARITADVEPERFVGELPETSAVVFDHISGELAGADFETLEDARDFVKRLRKWGKGEGIKVRDLLHPLRLALTGRGSGPEMAYLLVVLGAEESRRRVEAARRRMSDGLY